MPRGVPKEPMPLEDQMKIVMDQITRLEAKLKKLYGQKDNIQKQQDELKYGALIRELKEKNISPEDVLKAVVK